LTEELKVQPFLRKSTGLVKEIGPIGSFVIPWASMAGSGISVYAVEVVYNYPQGNVALAFLLVGIPVIFSVVTFAMLGMTTPRAAGAYVWAARFVDPFVGWFGTGWIYFLSTLFSLGLIGYIMGDLFPVIFAMMGHALGIPALTAFSIAMGTNATMEDALIIATIVIVGLLALVEIKHFMKVLIVVWALNLLGLIVSFALFAVYTPSTIPAAWNSFWGAGSYEMITSLATKYNLAGYVASTTQGFWNDTLSIVAYIFWALVGYELNAYMGGEVRNPRSSFLYWYTAGAVATVIWYVVLSWLTYNAYGNFILQYNYVYNLFTAGKLAANETAAVAPYMLLPSMPLFAASLGGTPIVEFLAAWWFFPITALLISYMGTTRTAFGLSFDRMFPAIFGKVSDRTHTPIEATVMAIIGAVVVATLDFTAYGFLVSAANTSFFIAFVYLIVAFTAIILPYKRPDIWEKGLRKKIFGLPEMTLFGLLAAVGMFWILALSTVGISILAWNLTILYILIGVVVFAFFVVRNEKKGIKLMDIYGEIPPP